MGLCPTKGYPMTALPNGGAIREWTQDEIRAFG